MISGIHGMFYSAEADALRSFIKDKLRIHSTDVGGGWLIFDLPVADLGVHPTDHPGSPPSGTHNVSFTCDDIHKTVADLKSRGVQFHDEITDQQYGHTIHFTMPGNVEVELYQPLYPRPSAAKATVKRAASKVKAKAKSLKDRVKARISGKKKPAGSAKKASAKKKPAAKKKR